MLVASEVFVFLWILITDWKQKPGGYWNLGSSRAPLSGLDPSDSTFVGTWTEQGWKDRLWTRLYGWLVTESVHFFHHPSVMDQIHWNTPFSTMENHLESAWIFSPPFQAGKFPTLVQHSDNLETKAVASTRIVSFQPADPPGGQRRSRRCEVRWSFSWRRWGWLGDSLTMCFKVFFFSPTFFCGGIFPGKTTHLA